MEENIIGADGIDSIACLNKKRKTHTELQEMPLLKHICWCQNLEHDSSSDSSPDPTMSRVFARGGPHPDNAKDSCSPDSVMSYPETIASVEASTSAGNRSGNSSAIGIYSLESRLATKSSSSESESLSISSEELDRLRRDYGLHIYEDHLVEFENYADDEYQTDKDLDEMLYSNGVAPSNYVLSSGRLSGSKDDQQGTRKQTIDKEFEEYFSVLML